MRRARVLWWLKNDAPGHTDTMNEMMDWYATNEVFLTPAAAQAFLDVHLLKSLQGQGFTASDTKDHYKKANQGLKTLRTELLRFRKRTFWELLRDCGRRLFKRKQVV